MKSKFLEEENGRTKKGVVTQRHGRPTHCTNHLREQRVQGERLRCPVREAARRCAGCSATSPGCGAAGACAHAHAHTCILLQIPAPTGTAVQDASCRWAWQQRCQQRLTEHAFPPSQQEETKPRSPAEPPRAPRGEAAARSWARPAKAWGAHVPQSSSGETRRCLLCLETHGKEFKTVSPSRRPGNATPLLSPAQPLLPGRGNGPEEFGGTCR